MKYEVAPITDIFGFPEIWPAVSPPPTTAAPPFHLAVAALAHLRSRGQQEAYSLPRAQEYRRLLVGARTQLHKYITTCGYNEQFDNWALKLAANASYTNCPTVDARCVKGTYRTRSGGCNSCYGDGTQIGPNCNTTATIACSSVSCFCSPLYAPAG